MINGEKIRYGAGQGPDAEPEPPRERHPKGKQIWSLQDSEQSRAALPHSKQRTATVPRQRLESLPSCNEPNQVG